MHLNYTQFNKNTLMYYIIIHKITYILFAFCFTNYCLDSYKNCNFLPIYALFSNLLFNSSIFSFNSIIFNSRPVIILFSLETSSI